MVVFEMAGTLVVTLGDPHPAGRIRAATRVIIDAILQKERTVFTGHLLCGKTPGRVAA